MAAEFARSRAEVEEMVGGADDVGVVLDYEDGVAEVAKLFHDVDEFGGVAGVEADAGLVEDVEGSDEAGSLATWPTGCAGIRRRRVWSLGGRG